MTSRNRGNRVKLRQNTKYLLIGLCLVIFLAIGLTVILANHSTKVPKPIIENKLPLQIGQSSSTSALNNDLYLINNTIKQESQDQSLANKAFKDKSYVINNPVKEKSRRLGLINLAYREVSATTQLSPYQNRLINSELDSAKVRLNKLNTENQLSSNYQSFSLLILRIDLIKVADDQQGSEILLSQLAAKLLLAINTAGSQGIAVTDLQADMTTFSSDVESAKSLTPVIENGLFNANSQKLLSGYNNKLKAPQLDIKAAYNAAKAIINIIQS